MDNKYNKLMDHIEVTDEMRDRILQNISAMNIEPAGRTVTPLYSAKRAKISRIIGIVAAAGIVLTVGGVILVKNAGRTQKTSDARPAFNAVDGDANGEHEQHYSYKNNETRDTVAGSIEDSRSQSDIECADDSPKYLAPDLNGITSGTSTIINRICYVDENGKDHIVSDPESICKILELVDNKRYGSSEVKSECLTLTLLGGNNKYEVTVSGENKDKVLEIILKK